MLLRVLGVLAQGQELAALVAVELARSQRAG